MKKKLLYSAICLFLLVGFATSGFAQWEKTNWPTTSSYFDFYINQDNLVARTWDTLNGDRTFFTSDNGDNWSEIAADSTQYILSMVIKFDFILAGTWNGFMNTPVGTTSWVELEPGGIPVDTTIWSLVEINTDLYAGTDGSIYKSSDNGINWTEVKTGIPAGARITSFASIGDAVFAGSDAHGVYLTTNNGTSWTAVNAGISDLHITQLLAVADQLFAVTLNGTFKSSNNGSSWTPIYLQNINCLVSADNKLYAGTDSEGIFVSTNNFDSWNVVEITGMPDNTRIFSMVASSDNLIAGTSDGVWRITFPSISLSVENENTPEMFVLDSNYPNPFNPTTTIGFSIPVSGNVNLSIYNISGQKIRTIVDTQMSRGAHQVVWDGLTDAGIRPPSGVYLYELRAGSFRAAKKLMLMK